MPYIGKEPEHGNYQLLDALTLPSGVFNGSRTVFNLTTDSVAVYPTSPTTMIISLGGVIQEPNVTYTVSGNQITFTTAPATSTTFFGVSLGDTLDIGTPSDGSVTIAKMANNSVDSAELVAGSVDLAHMSVDSVDSDQYVDGSIDTVHIGNLQITNPLIADDAVGADELAANAVVDASVASNAQITFNKMVDLTTSRALVTDGSGDIIVSGVTTTELELLDGLTSSTAELNLLDGVSGLVQADLTKLAAIDATAAEIDLLDALDRGSIIYGNSSGATTVLGQGLADTVLTSDGDDIAWQAPAASGLTVQQLWKHMPLGPEWTGAAT
jgi:hypothetical protein